MAASHVVRPLRGLGRWSLSPIPALERTMSGTMPRQTSRPLTTFCSQRVNGSPAVLRPLSRPKASHICLLRCAFSSDRLPKTPPPPPRSHEESRKTEPEAPTTSRSSPPPDFDFEHLKPQSPEARLAQETRPPQMRSQAEPEARPSSTKNQTTTTTTTTTSQSATKTRPSPSAHEEDPSLPSSIRSKTSPVAVSLSNFIDRAQTTLFTASQRINDLTGYTGIETLKERVTTLEQSLEQAQTHLLNTRLRYKAAVAERASTQREVTTLLARQKTWTPNDFERFTSLYRQDYELEASVAENAAQLEDAERETERLNRELSSGILARYHEEQIWSDKIRRMSTWGTWGLMAVNIFLFLVLQFGAEPWRRRRLVKGFEEKVREALAHEREMSRAAMLAGATAVAPVSAPTEQEPAAELPQQEEPAAMGDSRTDTALVSSAEPPTPPLSAPLPSPLSLSHLIPASWEELIDPEHWRAVYAELTSKRAVAMQMRDVSLIALEGVATGAAAVALSTVLFNLIFRGA
ncbi:Mdm33 family-domain-containing protein [Microdochium bolleyi]|uniref:Sensitive to high expression protein 9, mitochondrial n=1 Tax=Microdochium bolleyi TaxID=196109 RepID=A0A136J4P3_9PEZI|nr:Mdm33 family-domain-containing protein [Microdochium bolleyi]